MTFSESESLGGAIYVGFPDVSTSHDPPEGVSRLMILLASSVHDHHTPQRPTALPLVPYRADNTPFTPLPQMSQYMRDAQKTQWDVRFPHPHSELDHYPALVDGRVLSFIIHSPYLQVDFVVGREISEPEFTVEDVYESLYQMLCGSLSSTDPLYASRNGDERAKIEEATQQRISGTLTKISPWQGQVRDILGSRCIVGQIADDFNAGSWRIDFVEEFR